MYKIFFEDRLITISSKMDLNNYKANSIYLSYKNKKSFNKIVKLFRKNTEIKFLHISTKKTKQLFNKLKSKFKHINAAGGLVVNEKSQILIIKRNGKWDLPKGKVEKNEKLKFAAMREIEEECGISDLKIVKRINVTYHTYNFRSEDILKTSYWYLVNYSGNEKLTPQIEEDITEVKWLDFDKLDDVLSNTYASLIDVFKYAEKLF